MSSTTLAQAAGDALAITDKLAGIVPEIVLFIGASVVMMLGLSPSQAIRKSCVPLSVLFLLASGVAAAVTGNVGPAHPFPDFVPFAKGLVAIVGVLIVLGLSGTVDRELERLFSAGRRTFDPIRTTRGEFYAFFLFSLCGLMLVASADDLIWLFLALELTSLPTYVMVGISTARTRSQEAAVKYFFLGAFGAATFLMGFALLYGAAGTTHLFGDAGVASVLAENVAASGSIGTLATMGMVLSIIGLCFKIAAVPMHFYTADVYQGAAPGVSAMLAFVPKAAGVFALVLLLAAVGWTFGNAGDALPAEIRTILWVIAAATMIAGNVLALLQQSVKRMLAYSSVSHSGYLLVGLIAGPAAAGDPLGTSGIGAALFYLLCYGCMNLGTFAVLSALQRSGEEVETVDDLRGLCATHPAMGYAMVLCSLSLLGLPPLLGFWGKLWLFTSAISAGEILLVVILGLASAISAFYYLRIAGACFLDSPTDRERSIESQGIPARSLAALLSAGSTIALLVAAPFLMQQADVAAKPPQPDPAAVGEPAEPVAAAPRKP